MSRKIALSGMLLALNVILIIFVNIFQTSTIFFMGLASLPISIIIIRFGPRIGFAFYLGSVLLSFMLLSNKAHCIIYMFTFGVYGLIKYFIEKDRNIVVEYILKLGYANIALIIVYFIIKQFMYVPTQIYLIAVFEVAFLIYDHVYTLFLDFYHDKLEKIF